MLCLFLLPPRIGGIFIYEEDKPIRGIGAIEKRHQMGMLAFTDGWHLSIASGTQSLVFFIAFFFHLFFYYMVDLNFSYFSAIAIFDS